MNLSRDLIAEFVIMLGLCIGSWFIFVDGRVQELAVLEHEIEHTNSVQSLSIDDTLDSFALRSSTLREELAEIKECNAFFDDSEMLYTTIMSLARDHDVSVGRLIPSTRKSGQIVRSGAKIETHRISLSVNGPFDNMTCFLESLGSLHGFLRPASVQMTPVNDQPGMCSTQIHCDLLRFFIPSHLATVSKEDTE